MCGASEQEAEKVHGGERAEGAGGEEERILIGG